MKIRRESYGSLNFHITNLDQMMEVGLQKTKKERKKKKFYLPTQSHILDETWNKHVFFFGLSESKCRTVLLESVASKTDHDQHVIHAMSLHMII